jgi:hypothetical protein
VNCRRILPFLAAALLSGGLVAAPQSALDGPESLQSAWNRTEHGQRWSLAETRSFATEVASLHASLPSSARVRALEGWTSILLARDLPLAQKMPSARRGFADLDAAVALDPSDPEIRLLRAIAGYQAPAMLGRRSNAAEDFTQLVGSAGDVSPELRRRILYHAGSFALLEGREEANSLLMRALESEGPSPTSEVLVQLIASAKRSLSD